MARTGATGAERVRLHDWNVADRRAVAGIHDDDGLPESARHRLVGYLPTKNAAEGLFSGQHAYR